MTGGQWSVRIAAMTRIGVRPGWGVMRFSAGVLLLLLCTLPGTAADGGGSKHALKNKVEQMERDWRSAQLAGDTAAMDRMLAEDYVGMTMQGQVTTKAQQLRRMQERRTVMHRLDLSDVKVRLRGEVAVVTMRARVVGSGSAGPVDGRFRCRQIFHLLPNGRWAMTNFEADPMSRREHGPARAS